MRLPHDWTSEPAGGYGSLSHLVHTRCHWKTRMPIDLVLDEQKARQVIAGHECDDLAEQREEREAELAELRTKVDELAARLDTVATPTPLRTLVLDATTDDTLNASVDALAPADFLALATAVDGAQRRENERTALAEIREVLAATPLPDGEVRLAVGVLFGTNERDNGDFLSSHGQVLFTDGTTVEMEFPNAAETFMDLYDYVSRHATLAVDLRADTFTFTSEPSEATIQDRFGATTSLDDRIVAMVRATFAEGYDGDGDPIDGDPIDGDPIGVQFRAREEEDGYYLSRDEGMVLFADGTVEVVTFPGAARLFGEFIGCVGEHYTLSVHVVAGTVTATDNDWLSLRQRFGTTDPN